jgi:hypothetical protein
VIVADGDPRSRALAGLFPDAALAPSTGELPDIKTWLTRVLNRMIRDRRSAVLGLGGGDRVLREYGRDLRLVEFCARHGIEPLALYFLGPEEDLRHVLSIWEAGYFRPARCLLVPNEGVIREGGGGVRADRRPFGLQGDGRSRRGADPDDAADLHGRAEGARRRLLPGDGIEIDPVEQFMVEDWLADLKARRVKAGASAWLP